MDDKGGTLPQAGVVAEVADGATSWPASPPPSWAWLQMGSGCESKEGDGDRRTGLIPPISLTLIPKVQWDWA